MSRRPSTAVRRRLVMSVMAAVALSAAAAAAGANISSPAREAAFAAPPPATILLADAQHRVLEQVAVLPGVVRGEDQVTIGISDVATEGAGAPVVTAVPAAVDQELAEGDVAVELNGRPVIVLQGALPGYRDLRPGAKGPDVLQLNAALHRLGLLTEIDDEYGAATGTAVAVMFDRRGYQPALTADDALERKDDSVRAQQTARLGVSRARADARLRADGAARQAAAAQEALRLAQLGVTEADRQAASDALVARSTMEQLPVEASGTERVQAAVDLERAEAQGRLACAAARTAAMEASAAAAAAKEASRSAADPSQDAAVVDAEAALGAAEAARRELESRTGVMLPRSSLAVVPAVPVRLAALPVPVGGRVEAAAAVLSGPRDHVVALAATYDSSRIQVGQAARLQSRDDNSAPVPATVISVATEETEDPDLGTGRLVVLRPNDVQ